MRILLTEVWKGPATYNGWSVKDITYNTPNNEKPSFIDYGLEGSVNDPTKDVFDNQLIRVKDNALSFLLTFGINTPGKYTIPLKAVIYSEAMNKEKTITFNYDVNVSQDDSTVSFPESEYTKTFNARYAEILLKVEGKLNALLLAGIVKLTAVYQKRGDDPIIVARGTDIVKEGDNYRVKCYFRPEYITYGDKIKITLCFLTQYQKGKYIEHSDNDYTRYRRYIEEVEIDTGKMLHPDDVTGLQPILPPDIFKRHTLAVYIIKTPVSYNGWENGGINAGGVRLSQYFAKPFENARVKGELFNVTWERKELTKDNNYRYFQIKCYVPDYSYFGIYMDMWARCYYYKGSTVISATKRFNMEHDFNDPFVPYMNFIWDEYGWGIGSENDNYSDITIELAGPLKDLKDWSKITWESESPNDIITFVDENGNNTGKLKSNKLRLIIKEKLTSNVKVLFCCEYPDEENIVQRYYAAFNVKRIMVDDKRPADTSKLNANYSGPAIIQVRENTGTWIEYTGLPSYNNWYADSPIPSFMNGMDAVNNNFILGAKNDKEDLTYRDRDQSSGKNDFKEMLFLKPGVKYDNYPVTEVSRSQFDNKRLKPNSYPILIQSLPFDGEGIKIKSYTKGVITRDNECIISFVSNSPKSNQDPNLLNTHFTIDLGAPDTELYARWLSDGTISIYPGLNVKRTHNENLRVTLTYKRPKTTANKDIYYTLPWYRFTFYIDITYET